MRFYFLLLNLVLISSLTSCLDPGSWESSERIQQRGWAAPPATHNPESLYCYDTIGRKDCFAQPLVGEEDRLIAAYEDKTSRKTFRRDGPINLQK